VGKFAAVLLMDSLSPYEQANCHVTDSLCREAQWKGTKDDTLGVEVASSQQNSGLPSQSHKELTSTKAIGASVSHASESMMVPANILQ
jgi:hypothetical protein